MQTRKLEKLLMFLNVCFYMWRKVRLCNIKRVHLYFLC